MEGLNLKENPEMTEVYFVPPSDFMLSGVAQDIEPSDAEELRSSTGVDDIMAILAASRDVSFECYVATIDGRPVAVYGLSMLDHHGTFGCPWAVFTTHMRKYPKLLMRRSQDIVSRWKKMFPFLENYVDTRNKRSIRWLKRLGFEMKETVNTEAGDQFMRFEMRNV